MGHRCLFVKTWVPPLPDGVISICRIKQGGPSTKNYISQDSHGHNTPSLISAPQPQK